MHSNYLNSAIRQLRDQQVRFAPREKRLLQAEQAEKLLRELDPRKTYPYSYLCYRITNFRPKDYADLKLTGQEARHDLRLFVEDVSASANVPPDAVNERVFTVENLARQFNVSTKTIARWRERGLVGRRFLIGGRKRLGFLQSSVDWFVKNNQEQIRRSSRFSQLSDEERAEIIERARRLARVGGRCSEISKRLARRTGRSPETIRYTLRNFDRSYPEAAVFPEDRRPLSLEQKRLIYQQFQNGESVESLVERFSRTRNSIYRIIAEMRMQRIMNLPLEYVPNELFTRVRSKKTREYILGPLPPTASPPKKPRAPGGLPPYLSSLYEVPLLTHKQEVHLFRKMNYLKYLASKLRKKLDPAQPKRKLMDEIERLYEEAVATKNQIIRANLRLVVSIAKRHVNPGINFFELVSDGNMSLLRAVEKFDYARGYKFSTYASWAIMKNFARSIPDEHRRRERFHAGPSELLSIAEDHRPDPWEQEMEQTRREAQVQKILQRLDDREQKIIIRRFGLEHGQEPATLKEVGAELGVTKERVRQLEARALHKLRRAVEEEKLDFSN